MKRITQQKLTGKNLIRHDVYEPHTIAKFDL